MDLVHAIAPGMKLWGYVGIHVESRIKMDSGSCREYIGMIRYFGNLGAV